MWKHRRQFVLGPQPVEPAAGWLTTALPGLGYLSRCPELPLAQVSDQAGNTWHLLGLAAQVDPNGPEPLDGLAAAGPEQVEDVYASWAGRWALIGAGQLHMDAAGLLGCFFAVGPADDGLWVSSSAALLVDLTGADPTPTRQIEYGKPVCWYPGPRSRFGALRRLLPSQALRLADGRPLPRTLLPAPAKEPSYDDLLDQLQAQLVAGVRQAARRSARLFLPLTAGHDSRLLLATARYAGVTVETYTNVHDSMRKEADRTLPPKLARAAGFKHTIHKGRPLRQDLADLFDQHTGGHCADRDRFYVAHDYFRWTSPGDMLLRGGCFEAGRCYYWPKFPHHGGERAPDAEQIVGGLKAAPTPALLQALDEWRQWTEQTPVAGLDWRDRLYLEQRLGGWLSSIEQALDLIDADKFHAANSHSFFARVLQVPADKRMAGQHQIDLIGRMAPELLAFPFNPPNPKPVWKRVEKAVKNAIKSL